MKLPLSDLPLKVKLLIVAAGIAALIAAATGVRYMIYGPAADPSADRYPVRGIDISGHNGADIDFEAVAREGYRFVIMKSSEGSSFKDARYLSNIARARKAGLRVGVYHFFRFDAAGYMQALNFLHSLRGQRIDLPVVIDIEQWTNPTNRPTQRVIATLRTLIHRLEKEGLSVMIYTNKDGYDDFVAGRFPGYPLWICSLTDIDDSIDWTLWQYSHSGSVDGIDGAVDLNVFNGSPQQFEQWCDSAARRLL